MEIYLYNTLTHEKEKFKPILGYNDVKQPGKYIRSESKNDNIDPNEQKFVDDFMRLGQTIERIPKDSGNPATAVKAKPTNDFIWHDQGSKIELKALKTSNPRYKTVAKYIRDAVKQGKKNFIIHSEHQLKDKFLYQIREYNKRNPDNQLEQLWVVDDRGLFNLIRLDKK